MNIRWYVLAVLILLFILVAGIVFWPTLYRYDYERFNGNQVPVKINRLTGNVELLIKGIWLSAEDSKQFMPQIVPKDIESKVDGVASLSAGNFSGDIYNGSDWVISDIVVSVSAIDENKNFKWERKYRIEEIVTPLSYKAFSIPVADGFGVYLDTWNIRRVFGFKDPEFAYREGIRVNLETGEIISPKSAATNYIDNDSLWNLYINTSDSAWRINAILNIPGFRGLLIDSLYARDPRLQDTIKAGFDPNLRQIQTDIENAARLQGN